MGYLGNKSNLINIVAHHIVFAGHRLTLNDFKKGLTNPTGILDDLETRLNNLDAERVVISTDHGEAFGGYSILRHTLGSLHPQIRKGPWIVTSAEDDETYQPTVEEQDKSKMSREELDSQLEALGYRT